MYPLRLSQQVGQSPYWPDPYHQDSTTPGNYFSIDIRWNNQYANGSGLSPYGQYNTPVLAAAAGKVVFAGKADSELGNGYYVVISHDAGGQVTTGFSTRYLHLKQKPARKNGTLLSKGDIVQQGDQIGIMGTTGLSTGEHVHFGVRYNDQGYSYIPQLTKVLMEGLLLKSYQTECTVDSTGMPTSRNRYYTSTLGPTGN